MEADKARRRQAIVDWFVERADEELLTGRANGGNRDARRSQLKPRFVPRRALTLHDATVIYDPSALLPKWDRKMRATGHAIRVLHVDDEPDFATMAANFIEREDDRLTVDAVTSATEGLERLGTGEMDCIVSDYDMPGRNGIEFLEAVRAEHPDLPFVLYTGKGSEEVASEAISAGVTDYLQKANGTEQYALLANRVITSVERYRAQQEVDWQRAIIQNMGEGVYVFDDTYNLQYVNFRVQGIDGISEDGWQGRPVSYLTEIGVLSADETARIRDSIDRILDGETDECRLSVKPRLPEPVEVLNLRLVPVDTGIEGKFVLATSRDVTERDNGARGS